MKTEKEHIIDLIPDYLDQVLEDDQRTLFEAHIKICTVCAEELEQYNVLFDAFSQEEEAIPSSQMRSNFLEQLAQEKQEQSQIVPISSKASTSSFPWKSLSKIAASIAALVGAFLLGQYQQIEKSNRTIAALKNEELRAKQTAMLSLMENQSASKRIQGVAYIDGFADPDEAIVVALINRMHRDENANVRLTALEALSKFTTSPMVKEAYIKALSTEENPSIQIALIQNLVKVQEKRAIAPMKLLLEREETQPFVRDEIENVLPQII